MENNDIRIEDKLGNAPFFIARCYEEIKKTTPHKHENYYELVYLTKGEGFHWIETGKYVINTPEIYFLKPIQLHYWQFTSAPSGYVILFKKSFFNDLYNREIIDLILKLTTIFRIRIPNEYNLETIFQSLLEEFSNNGEFSSKIIHGYLMALFAKTLQIANIKPGENHAPNILYERYNELIVKECPRLTKVKDFAKLLNTTPQKLNAVCRRTINGSAKEPILNQLILECKRYLIHTEKSLTEIAFNLQFNDTSYFIKFFKKKVGISPLKFRKSVVQ